MKLLQLLTTAGASMVFLAIMFIPMERVFPAKRGQKIFRPQWWLDACFFAGQYLLWGSLVLWVLTYFQGYLQVLVPQTFRLKVQQMPVWLQAVIMFIASDLFIYWAHRLQHRVDFLWRFHKVHHTTEHMDWLAAHREHPLDSVYTIGIINLPGFIMGIDLTAMMWVVAFRGIWAIYIHSNVRLPLGPLKVLIGSPELHHWHHYKDRDAGNYANLSPLMDKLFGTYTCPDHEPEGFGIHDPFPRTYIGQMLRPLLPGKWWRFVERKKK